MKKLINQPTTVVTDALSGIAAAHPEITAHFYAGAGHGFNCDHRASYNAAAAKLARERTLAFFRQHVG